MKIKFNKSFAKLSLASLLFMAIISFVFFINTAEAPIQNDWNVTWYDCQIDLVKGSCKADVQNLNISVNRDFNLSLLVSETNFNLADYITKATIKEWKVLPTDVATYDTRLVNKTCYNDIPETNSTQAYDCSYYETYQNGTITKQIAQWKVTKANMQKEGVQDKMYYGLINIPKFGSKEKVDDYNVTETVNGIKTFLVEWDLPITNYAGGFGSSGKIAFIEEATQSEFHPFWNTSWAKCRNVTMTEGGFATRTNEPIEFNFTGLTGSNLTKEIRIIDASCDGGTGNEVPHEVLSTDSTTWAKVLFFGNVTNNTSTVWSIYYNNTNAGDRTGTYSVYSQVSWESTTNTTSTGKFNISFDKDDGCDLTTFYATDENLGWMATGGQRLAVYDETAGLYRIGETNQNDRKTLTINNIFKKEVTCHNPATLSNISYMSYNQQRYMVVNFTINPAVAGNKYSVDIGQTKPSAIGCATGTFWRAGNESSDFDPDCAGSEHNYHDNHKGMYIIGDNSTAYEHIVVWNYTQFSGSGNFSMRDAGAVNGALGQFIGLESTAGGTRAIGASQFIFRFGIYPNSTNVQRGIDMLAEYNKLLNPLSLILGSEVSQNTAPTSGNPIEPTDPSTFSSGASYQFNVTIGDADGSGTIQTVLFEINSTTPVNSTLLNSTNVTTNRNINSTANEYYTTKSDLPVGAYSYKFYANDSSGSNAPVQSGTFTINKVVTQLSLSGANVTYPTSVSVTGSESNNGDSDLTYSLFRNDSSTTNPDSSLLGASLYRFVYNTSGGANYSTNTTGIWVNVASGTPNVLVFIDDGNTNKTITYGATSVLKGNSTSTTTPPTFNIYISTLTATGNPSTITNVLASATHQIVYNTSGNANWTSASNSTIYLIVNKATPSLSTSGTGTFTYYTTSTVTGSETNANDTDVTYNLYRDSALKSNPETVELAVGTYVYVFNTSGGANWTSGTTTANLVINKATPNITFSTSNVTYPTAVNVDVSETNKGDGDMTYTLHRNGTTVTSPDTTLLAVGLYNYTYFVGSGVNYTANTNTTWVNVAIGTPNVQIFMDDLPSNKTTTYGTSVTIKGNSTSTTTPPTFNLYIGSVSLGSGNPASSAIIMPNGTHNVVYNTSGNANWTSTSNSSLYLFVNKNSQTLTLAFSPASGIVYGITTTASCGSTSSDSTRDARLFRNMSTTSSLDKDVTTAENNTAVTLGAVTWNYICNSTATENFTFATTNSNYVVNKASIRFDTYLNDTANANRTIGYVSPNAINVTSIINITSQNSFTLYENGTSRGTQSGQKIEYIPLREAGYWNYTSDFTGNENYTANKTSVFYTINKASSTTSLYLNGTQGDRFYYNNTALNVTTTVNVTGVSVNISSNYSYWVTVSGTTPLSNTSVLLYNTSTQKYNFTGFFETNANHSASSQTYYLTIDIDNPTFSSVQPANGSTITIGTTITMSATISDVSSGVHTVFLEYNVTNYTTSNTTSAFNKTLPNLQIGSAYRWWANDSVGNEIYSNSFVLNVVDLSTGGSPSGGGGGGAPPTIPPPTNFSFSITPSKIRPCAGSECLIFGLSVSEQQIVTPNSTFKADIKACNDERDINKVLKPKYAWSCPATGDCAVFWCIVASQFDITKGITASSCGLYKLICEIPSNAKTEDDCDYNNPNCNIYSGTLLFYPEGYSGDIAKPVTISIPVSSPKTMLRFESLQKSLGTSATTVEKAFKTTAELMNTPIVCFVDTCKEKAIADFIFMDKPFEAKIPTTEKVLFTFEGITLLHIIMIPLSYMAYLLIRRF